MRRKQIFFLVIFFAILTNIQGQDENCKCIDDKGIIIGYNGIHYSISKPSPDAGSYFDNGFFVGFFADVALNEKFHVQPEFMYTMSFREGVHFNTIAIPVMIKYFITNKISLEAGPMYDVIFDNIFMENSGINIVAGIGIKITEAITALMRYSDSLTSRGYIYNNESVVYNFNYLQVGLSFRLWKKSDFLAKFNKN